MHFRIITVLFLLVILVYSCSKQDDLPDVNRSEVNIDDNYQYNASNNAEAKLGRFLFYEKALSVNDAVSCGSCHKQQFAFADNAVGSVGFNQQVTSRNSPPIQNIQQFGFVGPDQTGGVSLFWDGRREGLNQMVLDPVMNHIEMGMRSEEDLVDRISTISYYKPLFEDAYGSEEVSITKIRNAMVSFVGSMISTGSKFHAAEFGAINYSALEQTGRDLFFNKYDCESCHRIQEPAGYDVAASNSLKFVNIGLDINSQDQGRADVTGNPEDVGRFKIPNLNNITLTAPYMHDGRFATLDEVLDHYSVGVKNNPNLDDRLKDQNGNPMVLNITEEEKRAMKAFLQTLQDNNFISDPKFSDPFN